MPYEVADMYRWDNVTSEARLTDFDRLVPGGGKGRESPMDAAAAAMISLDELE